MQYGSYEMSNDPYLSANRLSLIDRGFIFALAHVRGGGEMGRNWYEDGKYLHKKNTFTDFIACAEYLITEKYTSPAHLCIEVWSQEHQQTTHTCHLFLLALVLALRCKSCTEMILLLAELCAHPACDAFVVTMATIVTTILIKTCASSTS